MRSCWKARSPALAASMCWACAQGTATPGTILDQEQIQAARREDVLNSLSEIARRLRTRLGESLATVERHSTPLAEATTPSLEALKAYSTGLKAILSVRERRGHTFFPARRRNRSPISRWRTPILGLSYSVLGESVLSAESTTKAWQLRDRVSDRERFFIDFTYDRQVTGNLEKAYQTLELWLQTYPRGERQPMPCGLLAAFPHMGPADLKERSKPPKKQIAADPDLRFRYGNLASSYFFTGPFRRSRARASTSLRTQAGECRFF